MVVVPPLSFGDFELFTALADAGACFSYVDNFALIIFRKESHRMIGFGPGPGESLPVGKQEPGNTGHKVFRLWLLEDVLGIT